MSSPTTRTLESLRSAGYQAAVVEKWNHHVKIRQDLWGFGDVIACREKPSEILLVQATAAGVSERVAKIRALDAKDGTPGLWLRSGGKLEVWGWAKRRSRKKLKDGSRSSRMEYRRRRIILWWDNGLCDAELPDDQDEPIVSPRMELQILSTPF